MRFFLHRFIVSIIFRGVVADAAFGQGQEADYLANFDAIEDATYALVKDPSSSEKLPSGLVPTCANRGLSSNSGAPREVTVSGGGTVTSSAVASQCGADSVCIIPMGTTFEVNASIDLGALVVRGNVEWTDSQLFSPDVYLCAGYVAIEGQGQWNMDVQDKNAAIYIKNNGYVHPDLRSRAFGSHAKTASDYPTIDIRGRELVRTWSLLSEPLNGGDSTMTLLHDANLMGWRVGDRVGISSDEPMASGEGEEFTILAISERGTVTLDRPAENDYDVVFVPPREGQTYPALMSPEVVNLSRNIVITGDDYEHIGCDPNLPEVIPAEESSTRGCRCASYRTKCTVGWHSIAMNGGSARIQNTRLERCGQRGIEGKYCLHFHKLGSCPTCLFKGNSIEGSHQRGIIVHGTHLSAVEDNTLWNVRGAGIYIEDGNEMHNDIKYNVVSCPFRFNDPIHHGCTVPGTSNRLSDTSDNHSGIFSRAVTNNLIGNRVANAFNGMFFNSGGVGRGSVAGKVCESDARLARVEGNVWHGNGRFGTYTLGSNYAKATDQSILTDGENINKDLCKGFDSLGLGRGVSASMVDNTDYGNAFVGHYDAGDIQHRGHNAYSNFNNLYWKETKNFANGCSSHLLGASYADGNLALPDQASFIIENTTFGDGAVLEANHHCNVGVTGVLCFPQYILHEVHWKNSSPSRWMWFQDFNTQGHTANQNHGGVFTLSPPNAQTVMDGGQLADSFFPPGYVSLVSDKFSYLLGLPGSPCIVSTAYGNRYDGGILCRVPLRSLKVYSQNLVSFSAPYLIVEVWYGRAQSGSPDSSQSIPFHQIGGDFESDKQGYSLPVVPGAEHHYKLRLSSGDGTIPATWVVEFSDEVVGNRWEVEYINLSLNNYMCGNNGLVNSHHDRRFMWSGDQFMSNEAWGNTGACAADKPGDLPKVDCSLVDEGRLMSAECPELCSNSCGETSYCDCGSATCKIKSGFTEAEVDLCAAARCSDHGSCAAKYLGSNLPTTSSACICDEGWSGSRCQFNPCQTLGIVCQNNGRCAATSDTSAQCICKNGYSGDLCEKSCDGICTGNGGDYPFGCNPSVGEDIVQYRCGNGGGCEYWTEDKIREDDSQWCTFKESSTDNLECTCNEVDDCMLSTPCNNDGSCPTPTYLPDGEACNSTPFGVCQQGVCAQSNTTPLPTSPPVIVPTGQPVTPNPSSSQTSNPSLRPTSGHSHCGCEACTQEVWTTPAINPSNPAENYSCGSRITWMTSVGGGGLSLADACDYVAAEDFSGGQTCSPCSCQTSAPTNQPSSATPTYEPTSEPTPNPTLIPSRSLTREPSYCGCEMCTQEVWTTPAINPSNPAENYSCGSRITWMTSVGGGGLSLADACDYVAAEDFSGGQTCSPCSCQTSVPTNQPSTATPTIPDMLYCGGCETCTESIWNSPATALDNQETYSCGSRISYLINSLSYEEDAACSAVGTANYAEGQPCAPCSCQSPQVLNDPDPAMLIFSDEFETDGAPDATKWTYDLGDGCSVGICGWGNDESQYYTSSPSNVHASNGVLSITARKENGFSRPYTSTRMVTRGLASFKYGRVQFRANIAKCKATGTWSALWMLPETWQYGGWPDSGEIDVMEAVGFETDLFHGSVHTRAWHGGNSKSGSMSAPDQDWHVFEIDWQETTIRFAVDGLVYYEFDRESTTDKTRWPFDQEFHLIMNIAVGGAWGGLRGIDDAAFEGDGQIMEIDYVRVYGSPSLF